MLKFCVPALLLLIVFSQLVMAVQDHALIVYFDFEDMDGNAVKDKSAKGNDGTIVGGDTEEIDGKRGKGLRLDGQDDHIAIEYNDSLRIDKAVTYVGWFYFTDLTPNNNLIDTRIPNQWKDTGFNLWIKDASRNSIISPNADAWAGAADSRTSATEEKWTHIALVVNNTIGKIWLYLDGSLDVTADVPEEGMGISEQPMIIGARADIQAGTCMDGIIDDIAVWNVALTAEEIAQVFGSGPAGVSPGVSFLITWGKLRSQ